MTWRETADLSDEFFAKFKAMCSQLGCDPVDMARVLYTESGMRADIQNALGHSFYGLNQLWSKHFPSLGFLGTPEEYMALKPEEQLTYVERYFQPYKGSLGSLAAVYVRNFLPADIRFASDPDFVLVAKDGRRGKFYYPNRGFDLNRDGRIEVRELEAFVRRNAVGPRWNEILYRLTGEVDDRVHGCIGSTEWVQRSGTRLGVDMGPIDGVPGPRTTKGIRELQRKLGVRDDGIAGPQTVAAIKRAVG